MREPEGRRPGNGAGPGSGLSPAESGAEPQEGCGTPSTPAAATADDSGEGALGGRGCAGRRRVWSDPNSTGPNSTEPAWPGPVRSDPASTDPVGSDHPGMPSGADPWDVRSEEWAPTGGLSGGGQSRRSSRERLPEGPPSAGLLSAGSLSEGPSTAGRLPAGDLQSAGPQSAGPLSAGPQGFGAAFGPLAGPAGTGAGSGPSPSTRPSAGLGGPTQGGRVPYGSGDPVKALLHRHRELCERAVDPLEIAVGLEAQGVTDRTAAHCRHRDVFSLAEELHARVPRTTERPSPEPQPLPVPRVRAGWLLLTLLPGALGAATVTGLRLTQGTPHLLVALGGLLAVALATRAALRHSPLAGPPATRAWRPAPGTADRHTAPGARAGGTATDAPAGRTTIGTRVWTLWLLGYALLGDGLLHAVLTDGPDAPPTGAPDGPWPTATAPALALLLACAPAAWCAHLLAVGAHRGLAGSRTLRQFTAAVTPSLLGAYALFLAALAALLALSGTVLHQPAAYPQALTLGALLLSARLLTAHRHRRVPARALGAAALLEVLALALLTVGRLPDCAFLAVPVQTLVDVGGEAAVPVLACGTAALALLWHAGRTLTRASAHAPTRAPE